MTAVDRSLKYLPGGYVSPGWATDGDTITGFPNGRGTSLVAPGSRRAHGRDEELVQRGISAGRGIRTPFPETGIGQQLKQVAGVLAAGGNADSGQVFLAQLGGFATSSSQMDRHSALLRQLSDAMGAFYRATVDLGISNRVVTYTDTEFSRTLAPNAKNGTDRGWGGHQLVMGGSVIGGEVHGEIPALQLGGEVDVTGSGVWLPAITKRRYSGAFASWMGMPVSADMGPGPNFLA
jgi:uncharacterized protein (DUF1501 family)